MSMKYHLLGLILLLFGPITLGQSVLAQDQAAEFSLPATDDGLPGAGPIRRYGWFTNLWKNRRAEFAKRMEEEKHAVVFLGDSITHSWETAGKKTWNKYYQKRKALNLGFSGDRTEHVLWRLNNGEFEEVQPKVVVLMIGTNNTGHRKDPPKAIAAGVEKIIERINMKSPTTKILLLAIFPRAEKVSDPQRKNNDRTNALIKQMAKKDSVTYLDINERFLLPDGTLSKEIMPDLLHPKQKGYAIWAEAIEPSLRTLLAEDS